ncbi:MAG: glycosyltransferase [Elusimicrobiales bacterium]|nr:glycosyltransferase [Elusimicrobiales bacterium]
MKFCVLSSLASRSGSSIRNRGICRALAGLGHQVEYLEPVVPGDEPPAGEGFGQLPYRASFASPALWTIPALFHNAGRLLELKPDMVMVMKPFAHTALPALLARLAHGARVVMDFDDLDCGYFSGGAAQALVEQLQLFFLRRADRVCVHNPALRAYLEENGVKPGRITFLGQGIDPEKYRLGAAPAPALPKDWETATVLLYAAHLGPAAALEPILKLTAELPGNFRLLVVGGGARLEEFRLAAGRLGIEGRTLFTGYLPHAEALGWLRRGQIALNYLWENEPREKFRSQIKLREYLALGLPVVSSRGGDVELFGEFLEIAADDADFRNKVLKTAAGLPAAAARAARGRAWVNEKFSWAGLVREWLAAAELEKL